MKRIVIPVIGFGCAAMLWGMTVNGSLAVLGTLTAEVVNFSAATSTAPNKSGTSLPATCSIGQTYFKTDAAAGQNLQLCTAANTWTAISGGGGATESAAADPTILAWMTHKEECMSMASSASTGTAWVSGENIWYLTAWSGSGYSVSGVQPVNADMNDGPKHPGQWLIQTGATSGTALDLALAPYAKTSPWLNASATGWKACWVFRLGTTTQMTAWIGVGNDMGTFAWANYLGLYYDATTAVTNFRLRTGKYSGGTNADYDTGVAGDTNWHTLCIRGDDTVTGKVWMKLDGVEKSFCDSGCDVTATIVNDKALQTEIRLKSAEAVTKSIYLDYYGAKSKVSAGTTR